MNSKILGLALVVLTLMVQDSTGKKEDIEIDLISSNNLTSNDIHPTLVVYKIEIFDQSTTINLNSTATITTTVANSSKLHKCEHKNSKCGHNHNCDCCRCKHHRNKIRY